MVNGDEKKRKRSILVLLCAAFFMVVTDSTSVFAAIPTIHSELGFTTGKIQWITTAYALTFAGLLLLGGRSSDLLGRRRMFMIGVGGYVGASLVCGLAWTDDVLIAARALQGVAGAIMTPAALAILMTHFQEGHERNKALGVWGALGGLGATAGLLIGGPVTYWLGWKWIFFLNVPIGIAVVIIGLYMLKKDRPAKTKKTFDAVGAVTITAALFLLVFGITAVPDFGWMSMRTSGALVGAAVVLFIFIVIQLRSKEPLVPLRIFRSRTLVGGNLVGMFAIMCVDGMLFTFTQYSQQALNYSAVQFGLVMTFMTLISVAGVSSGQHFTSRFGFQKVGASGMALIGLGCLILANLPGDGSWVYLLGGLLFFGFGMGAAFVAAQIAALAGVAERDAGLASGVEETTFSVGSALGVAIVAAVMVAQSGEFQHVTIEEYRFTFGVVGGFSVMGMLLAMGLLGNQAKKKRRKKTDNINIRVKGVTKE
ncbi:MFS transporter [Paenibacillaceae bacterium]|nr:MFS transporter [Paenibacillaceae bacterium]